MSDYSTKGRSLSKRIVSYFFQGLLITAPSFFTILAIVKIFEFFDSNTRAIFENVFHYSFPGIGILVFAAFITVTGFIGSTVLVQPVVDLIESLLEHTPLVKDIYSSVKDFISAFISNKKKFNKPVIVEIGKGSGIHRMGFITREDLSDFDIQDKVAVYFPQSYTFAGHLFVINKDQVTLLPPSISANMVKFILSGGVMDISDEKYHPNKAKE